MNVHSIINPYVQAINPNVNVTLHRSTGWVQAANFTRTPQFTASTASAQVQPMTAGDIEMTSSLNIQGVKKKMYINGQVEGLVRGEQHGGDYVTLPDGTDWKIAYVFEAWPDWCSAMLTLQVV